MRNINIRQLVAVLGIGGALLAGCLGEPEENEALGRSTTSALTISGDTFSRVVGFVPFLAGRDLNGTDLNGRLLDGRVVVSVSLLDVRAAAGPLREVSLSRTVFHGLPARGRAVGGSDFGGARFAATLDDGSSLTLAIESMERGADRATRDVTFYVVSYATREDGRRPLCGIDERGDPITAIPLEGRWDMRGGVPGGGSHIDDPAAFTFACRGYVLAKCVEAGYEPWRRALLCDAGGRCEWATLAAHHQACTRALRADFCGDGASFTADGTLVNLCDGLGVRIDGEDWLAEAEWDDNGARCVARERISGLVPPCLAARMADGCGDAAHFGSGTLLVTEVEPR